jgi:hypothetical protein
MRVYDEFLAVENERRKYAIITYDLYIATMKLLEDKVLNAYHACKKRLNMEMKHDDSAIIRTKKA